MVAVGSVQYWAAACPFIDRKIGILNVCLVVTIDQSCAWGSCFSRPAVF